MMLFCFQNIYAQKIISKKDSVGGNVYTTQMDSRINDLLTKSEESCNRPAGPKIVNNTGGGSVISEDRIVTSTPSVINTKRYPRQISVETDLSLAGIRFRWL